MLFLKHHQVNSLIFLHILICNFNIFSSTFSCFVQTYFLLIFLIFSIFPLRNINVSYTVFFPYESKTGSVSKFSLTYLFLINFLMCLSFLHIFHYSCMYFTFLPFSSLVHPAILIIIFFDLTLLSFISRLCYHFGHFFLVY